MNSWLQYFSNPENINNLIASFAVIISAVSTAFAVRAVNLQRDHNRKSVEPLPDFIFGNYENKIEVRLHNHGLGPMRLIKVEVLENNAFVDNNLIDVMPPHPKSIPWEDYVRNLEDRVLAPGEEKPLIILSGEPKNLTFARFRDKVRKRLIPLTVRVYYKGIYDEKELTHEKALENWFS